MNFPSLFMAILLLIVTGISLYGILKKRDWVFNPDKGCKKHPLFSSQNLFNGLIFKLFGHKGVAIFEIMILIFLWIAWFYSVIQNWK